MCLPCQINATTYMANFIEQYSQDPWYIVKQNWAFFSLESKTSTEDLSKEAKKYLSPEDVTEIAAWKGEVLFSY